MRSKKPVSSNLRMKRLSTRSSTLTSAMRGFCVFSRRCTLRMPSTAGACAPWFTNFRNASCFRAKIEPVDLSWVPHPAQRVVAERLETAVVADHRSKLGRNEHLAAQGLTQGFDARNFVDRRPDYGEVEAVDGADVAIEHLAEMEREVDCGHWLAGLAPRGIEPIETIHRFPCRVESLAAGLIPRCIHEGKDREHAVTEEFQHLATARAQ